MVEKLKQILNKIVQEKGEVTVFAFLKTDDLIDKWSIIFSASWATNIDESFEYIKRLLDRDLTPDEKLTIARIGIFSKNEQIIQSLLQFNSDTKITEATKINGFTVQEGYVLKSNRNT